jgi:hypothetical protein
MGKNLIESVLSFATASYTETLTPVYQLALLYIPVQRNLNFAGILQHPA